MPVRVGMLGVSHVHAPSYVHCLNSISDAELVGHWDKDGGVADAFAGQGSTRWDDQNQLLEACDAVVIAGENLDHAEAIETAASHGKSVLCEKPLAASEDQAVRVRNAVTNHGIVLATAFPCPFSPAFESTKSKVDSGEIGKVLSVCATNHGKCPGGWFTDPTKSGGGAMIDHTVHVADLLRRLLKQDAVTVQAVTGNNMYGETWEDTAMLTICYSNGVFASLDSSWSRPKSYKAWGDVTLKIVGEKGVIELDLFVQSLDMYSDRNGLCGQIGYGSNLDRLMIQDFLRAHNTQTQPRATLEDGLAASRIAFAAYRSAASGQLVAV